MGNFTFYLSNGYKLQVTQDNWDDIEIDSEGNYKFFKNGSIVTKVFGAFIMAYERW